MVNNPLSRSDISDLLRISESYLLLSSFEANSSSPLSATTFSSLHSIKELLSSHFIGHPTLPASISQEIMLQSLACLVNYSSTTSNLAIIVAFNTRILLPVHDPCPALTCCAEIKFSDKDFLKVTPRSFINHELLHVLLVLIH